MHSEVQTLHYCCSNGGTFAQHAPRVLFWASVLDFRPDLPPPREAPKHTGKLPPYQPNQPQTIPTEHTAQHGIAQTRRHLLCLKHKLSPQGCCSLLVLLRQALEVFDFSGTHQASDPVVWTSCHCYIRPPAPLCKLIRITLVLNLNPRTLAENQFPFHSDTTGSIHSHSD